MLRSIAVVGYICRKLRVPAVVLIGLTLAVGALLADQRFLVPQEDPGGPFYARIEWGLVHHTEDWAAIAFYRELDCVPSGFNLLRFFDPIVPRVFSCPLTVHGFVIYKDYAPGVAPIQSKIQGNGAVQIWFVRWDELQAAIADNRLTKTELLEMQSLMKGTASFFQETLHPTGGAQRDMLELTAFGSLEDGRSFDYQVAEVEGSLAHVKIEFK